MHDLQKEMIETQLIGRGISDKRILQAMMDVPREEFVNPRLVEFAYADTPLPIEEQQTISQPFIVAFMIQALETSPEERVLEIGTGSGYSAAVLSKIVSKVYTIERHASLVESAELRLKTLGFNNVHVLCGDGTKGWPEKAPFDAIVVTAGGKDIPPDLFGQLKIGGRLVMPAGETLSTQRLIRVTKLSEKEFNYEDLGAVNFVPLIGEAGWKEEEVTGIIPPKKQKIDALAKLITQGSEVFENLEEAPLDGLLKRIGNAKIVLIGEATHGTSEFYKMRARITQELIEKKGFNIVALEADWPDANHIDHYVRHSAVTLSNEKPFNRFPTWMWANHEVLNFVHWLRNYNSQFNDPKKAVSFNGLDIYSLFNSADIVIKYLEGVDKEAAKKAKTRYACFSAFRDDPSLYGMAIQDNKALACEKEVLEVLQEMLKKNLDYKGHGENGWRFFDAAQNARIVAEAEKYYRLMYSGDRNSWNLRDSQMFKTLQLLLEERGPESKVVVWAHNSHLGNAKATEMSSRGEFNIGQLCKQKYGNDCYSIGFGTHQGTVAAASYWGGAVEFKDVIPSHPQSYEYLCHKTHQPMFFLPLLHPKSSALRDGLMLEKLERAIGVLYLPETELASHYFYAILPKQFDEYIWFDKTNAVSPLEHKGKRKESKDQIVDTFPFGI